MNPALKWKMIAGFLLVFIAGGVTGAFLATNIARNYLFGPPPHGWIADRMRDHLRRELRLTPEQMTKVSPIIEKTAAHLEEIRADSARRVHETFADSHKEMAAVLTKEQQERLEEMPRRHAPWFRPHPHGPGPHVLESPSP